MYDKVSVRLFGEEIATMDAQAKYIQPSKKVHADMADTAKQAGQVFGKREVIKSSNGKHPSNRQPAKKKRK